MKQILFAIAFVFATGAYAQEAYILTKEGEKIEYHTEHRLYSSFGKLRYYKNKEGFKSEKSIKLEDIDKVVGKNESFVITKLEGKKPAIFKVLAQGTDKKFLVNMSPSSTYDSYTYQIEDNDGKIIATGRFQNMAKYIKRHAEDQNKAVAALKKYFPNCPDLYAALATAQKEHDELTYFFFGGPTYNCQ